MISPAHEISLMWLEQQKTKLTQVDKNLEKKFNDEILLLTEDKLKVERLLSHVQLDTEHLIKNEAILTDEIYKKTKGKSCGARCA